MVFHYPLMVVNFHWWPVNMLSQRGRRPFLAPAQGTQLQFMSPFVLCPLAFSAVMQKLRNTVPEYLGSSELLNLALSYELG